MAALILGSIVTLVLFVKHTAQSTRGGGMIGLVGDRTRRQVEQLGEPINGSPRDRDVVPARRHGVVIKIHHEALVGIAARAGCLLELVPAVGDFTSGAAPLRRVHGTLSEELPDRAALAVILGPDRTRDSDPAFGIRKPVGVAERSIYSSPFQAPTTSVQAIDAIHVVGRSRRSR